MSGGENTIAAIVGNTPVNEAELSGLLEFKTEPTDIIIVSYPKTGTTWMQQICHQLRTGGHIDFDEISDEGIVPWLEVGPFVGVDVCLPQVAQPRCFKSHARLSELSFLEAGGTKYVCLLRDPEAAMVSWFKFNIAKSSDPETKDVNDWAPNHFLSTAVPGIGCHIWDFYIELWKCRKLRNVLLVVYEKLKIDLAAHIPRIAAFMGLPAPASDAQAKIEELCSFGWMSKHPHLFDDHHMATRKAAFQEQFPELAEGKAAGKAKLKGKGKGKDGKDIGKAKGKNEPKPATKVGLQVGDEFNTQVSENTRELLARAWREHVTPITGHDTYEDMAAEV